MIDEPVVVDGNLITARFPYDLPRMVVVKQLVGSHSPPPCGPLVGEKRGAEESAESGR